MTHALTLGPVQIIDCGFGHIAEVEMLIEDEVNLDQSKSHLPSLVTKVGYNMEEVQDVEFNPDLGNEHLSHTIWHIIYMTGAMIRIKSGFLHTTKASDPTYINNNK